MGLGGELEELSGKGSLIRIAMDSELDRSGGPLTGGAPVVITFGTSPWPARFPGT